MSLGVFHIIGHPVVCPSLLGPLDTCHRDARPSSYTFGYTKTRKITYKIFNCTCESSLPFSLVIFLRLRMFQVCKSVPKAYTNYK